MTIQSLPELARKTVETYINQNQKLAIPESGLDAFRQQQAGVFVTLKTATQQLRGCIGTIAPVCANILEETIQNAISAATRDPRFKPVQKTELDGLLYSVSVLHAPEQIFSTEALDPRRYGVIVASRGKRGLLLPDLEGINTVDEQVTHAMYKGGIFPTESIELYRFQVDKYE